MTHWLLTVAIPKAESAAIYTTISSLTVVFIVAPFKNLLKRARKHVSRALDSLDPDVPVGLTKQIDDLITKVERIHDHLDIDSHPHVPPTQRAR